ncbi:SDR family oxidoreductase [Candidatus Mesenet endosymbiont of Phosphuga atrata]|uniref:SDR family oxidoreductase n=1 Tax=Candidatus Mesenet endosymbiont of Phosphuga atrata TaxID=3066221 RepID=UPI0030CE4A5C
MHLFCFGYGYVAKFLAQKLANLDWKISGTSSKTNENADINILNYNSNLVQSSLLDATHVLISIPPNGDNVLEKYSSYFKNVKWIGYLSATSVYGEHYGHWVTEDSETKPIEERGIKRLECEKKWRQSNLPVHFFRLAAIYGPDRNALVDLKLGKAKSVIKEGHVFSRIHVEDIASILFSSINSPDPGEVYNCADDLPSPQIEVITYAANLLKIEPPAPIHFSKLPKSIRSFYNGTKRISNAKIKTNLNVVLQYPTYKEGLIHEFKRLA